MAPLRATQHFPVRLHHRLQNLQTGRDAQAMECFPDTVDHAEDRQRHLDRDGARAGGLAGRLPPVMLRHGWQSPFDCIPCPTTGQGQEPPPASSQLKFNSVRDIPQNIDSVATVTGSVAAVVWRLSISHLVPPAVLAFWEVRVPAVELGRPIRAA